MITEGLIAIGIIALIAALFLLGGRAKTRQSSQHVRHKHAATKHSVALAEPSGSAKTLTPFPVSQAPFPMSTTDQHSAIFTESSRSAKILAPLPVTQASFPLSNSDISSTTLAEPSEAIEETLTQFDVYAPEDDEPNLIQSSQAIEGIQASSPIQMATLAQTPVQQTQPIHAQVQDLAPPVAFNEQPTAKLLHDVPETPTPPSSLAATVSETPTPASPTSKTVPEMPAKPMISRSLRRPQSIEEQMAALTADAWALQQQTAEIVRRLSYLSACIEHSLASAPYEPDDHSNYH